MVFLAAVMVFAIPECTVKVNTGGKTHGFFAMSDHEKNIIMAFPNKKTIPLLMLKTVAAQGFSEDDRR